MVWSKSYTVELFSKLSLSLGTSTVSQLEGDHSSEVKFLAAYLSSNLVPPMIFWMTVRTLQVL